AAITSPAAPRVAAAASALAPSRAVRITRNPLPASCRHTSKPMPRLAPVTSAVRCSLIRSVRSSFSLPVILIHTDRFAEHQTPPGHPERPERAEVLDAIAAGGAQGGTEVVPPRPASREHLLRVHDGDYLRRMSETS